MDQTHRLGVDGDGGHLQVALGPCGVEITVKHGELSG